MRIISGLIFFLSLCVSKPLFAQFELDESRIKPELGIWFGPAAAFPGTELAGVLNTNLGGGIFFRINLPSNTFRMELGSSLNYYTSSGSASLVSVPTYGAGAYSLPLELPLLFQIKLGMAFHYFKNQPEKESAIHPAVFSGFEMSFPAGKIVNIGLRIDYYFAIESYLTPPAENPDFVLYDAHFIHVGLMISFNFNSN